jgi:hypothetical protein
MNFARVLTESGLTKIDLAAIYGVSRQTVHAWSFTAPPRANSLLARQAEVITQALILAIDRGVLPLEATDRATRQEHIAKMAEKLQGLKLAPTK